MTTPASDARSAVEVEYEGPAPSFGGFDSADFVLDRPHHHRREVNVRLAVDARALLDQALADAGRGPLDAVGAQAVLRALAARLYASVPDPETIPPIVTLRARDVAAWPVRDVLSEAGLL